MRWRVGQGGIRPTRLDRLFHRHRLRLCGQQSLRGRSRFTSPAWTAPRRSLEPPATVTAPLALPTLRATAPQPAHPLWRVNRSPVVAAAAQRQISRAHQTSWPPTRSAQRQSCAAVSWTTARRSWAVVEARSSSSSSRHTPIFTPTPPAHRLCPALHRRMPQCCGGGRRPPAIACSRPYHRHLITQHLSHR